MANISERDFRGFDLNLLLVFHALVEERSVTRAAARLYIGQPAVSGALKRLRVAFDDELFVRTSHGMEPTSRALEFASIIKPLLCATQQALQTRPSFDPANSERVFRIGLSDSLEVSLIPTLLRRLARVAPKVRVISRVSDRSSSIGLLDSGDIELAIGVLAETPSWHRYSMLFTWTFVSVFSRQHVKVRAKRIALAEYLRYPHVLTSFNASLAGFIDEQLKERGLSRRVVFSSPHFATSPLIVAQMPAISTVPTFIAATWCDSLGLSVSPVPFDVPTYEVGTFWTARDDSDAGLQWLIADLRLAFANKMLMKDSL